MILSLVLIAGSLLAMPMAVQAATLIEVEAGDDRLRIVVDRVAQRVRIEDAASHLVLDLGRGLAFVDGGKEPLRARFHPGHDDPGPFRLERFGPGPMVAGHASVYHVLFAEDQVCAEVLGSRWMVPFLDPAVRALAILEGLKGEPLTATASDADEPDVCSAIPITTLAAAGWPLLVGKIDRPTFATTEVRFDYQPARRELALPPAYEPPREPDPGA